MNGSSQKGSVRQAQTRPSQRASTAARHRTNAGHGRSHSQALSTRHAIAQHRTVAPKNDRSDNKPGSSGDALSAIDSGQDARTSPKRSASEETTGPASDESQ